MSEHASTSSLVSELCIYIPDQDLVPKPPLQAQAGGQGKGNVGALQRFGNGEQLFQFDVASFGKLKWPGQELQNGYKFQLPG